MSPLLRVQIAYAPWIVGFVAARISAGVFPLVSVMHTLTAVHCMVGRVCVAGAAAMLAHVWPFCDLMPVAMASIFPSNLLSLASRLLFIWVAGGPHVCSMQSTFCMTSCILALGGAPLDFARSLPSSVSWL